MESVSFPTEPEMVFLRPTQCDENDLFRNIRVQAFKIPAAFVFILMPCGILGYNTGERRLQQVEMSCGRSPVEENQGPTAEGHESP